MTECVHGEPLGVLVCPACQRLAADPEPMAVYARTTALRDGRCPLECDAAIMAGDPIALVGEDHDHAVWAHEECAELARG